MRNSLKLMFALLVIGGVGSADEAVFSVVRKDKSVDFASYMTDSQIRDAVTSTLNIDLNDGTYSDVGVTTHDGYMVAHLFGNDYSAERVRMQKEEDGSYSVMRNYSYYADDQQEVCASCPDESVRIVCSGSFSNSGHISRVKVKEAYDQLSGSFKVKHLGGREENRESIMSWLSCKNLVMWGRIGHGSQRSISFAGSYAAGDLTPQDMAGCGLKDKLLIINSCYVHNSNFTGPIKGAGAKFFCGGNNVTLLMNQSEEVWRSIMVGGAKDKKEFNKLVEDGNKKLSAANRYGKTAASSQVFYAEVSK